MKLLFLSWVLVFSLVANADTIKMKNARGLSVKLDKDHRIVDLSLPKDDAPPADKTIGVTLFDVNGGKTPVVLKALNADTSDNNILYRGSYIGAVNTDGGLSPLEQSVTGFEIQIPFGPGSSKTVKSTELEKDEQ